MFDDNSCDNIEGFMMNKYKRQCAITFVFYQICIAIHICEMVKQQINKNDNIQKAMIENSDGQTYTDKYRETVHKIQKDIIIKIGIKSSKI